MEEHLPLQSEDAPDEPISYIGPIFFLIIACAIVFTIAYSPVDETSDSTNFSEGLALGAGAIMWTVFYVAFRNTHRKMKWIAAIVLVLTMMLGVLLSQGRRYEEARVSPNVLQDIIGASMQPAPKPTAASSDAIVKFAQQRDKLGKAYIAELTRIGFWTLLNEGRLEKDKGMKQSYAILAKAEAAFATYKKALFLEKDRYIKRVLATDLSPARKEEFLRHMKSSRTLDSMLSLESKSLAKVRHTIEDLEKERIYGIW